MSSMEFNIRILDLSWQIVCDAKPELPIDAEKQIEKRAELVASAYKSIINNINK